MLNEPQIATVIAVILKHEGGYSNNPNDAGGSTNFGITQSTADENGFGDVRNLTSAKAAICYRELFAKWKIDSIPDFNTFALVADSCVNHGQGWGIRWLQTAIHVLADGVLGPKTRAALAVVTDWPTAYDAILAYRVQFYGHLISHNPVNAQFADGWLIRAASFISPRPKWT